MIVCVTKRIIIKGVVYWQVVPWFILQEKKTFKITQGYSGSTDYSEPLLTIGVNHTQV